MKYLDIWKAVLYCIFADFPFTLFFVITVLPQSYTGVAFISPTNLTVPTAAADEFVIGDVTLRNPNAFRSLFVPMLGLGFREGLNELNVLVLHCRVLLGNRKELQGLGFHEL
nr:hypothetical protein Iba_chr05eCG8540 [Ipomoea batatas]